MLVIAGCGGGGGTLDDTESVRQAAQMKLDDAVMKLDTALKKAEAATTPTPEQIEAIKKEYMELQEAIKEVATGVNTDDAQKLLDGDGTIMSYTERLVAIENKQTAATSTRTTPDPPPPPAKTTADQLGMAVDELNAAVTAGNIDTPTQALIDAIDSEIRELQTAITNVADGVDTTAATTALNTAMTTRGTINTRFVNLPDPDDSPARSTGNLAGVTITRDATTDPQNPVWKITIPGFNNAVHELPDADLSAIHSWNSITSDDTDDTRTGGSAGDVYAIAVYGKLRDNNGTPEFDGNDRMGFGAWVNNGSIEVDNTDYVPTLIDGVGDGPAIGRMYLDAKTGTATYEGRVAAIVESVDAGGHYPTGGTVDLSADFGTNMIGGMINLGDGTGILLPDVSITSSHEVTGTAMLNRGRATTTGDVNGANTGTWNARFVHEGRWIVGDFDLEPYGTDKTIADQGFDLYQRYKGAFGAVEQP